MIEWIALSKKPEPVFGSVRKMRHTEKTADMSEYSFRIAESLKQPPRRGLKG